MRELLWQWSQFLEAEPVWAPGMLACVIATLVAVGYALHVSTHGTTRGRLLAIAPATLLTLLSMAILFVLIGDAREAHMRVLLDGEYFGHRHFEPECEWLLLLAPILVVALPTLVFSLARALRSRALKLCAPLVSISSLAILVPDHAIRSWSFHMDYDRYAADVLAHGSWLDALSLGVLLLGTLIVVVLGKPVRVAKPTIAAMLVFACGAAAFVATRGHAADRQRSFSMTSEPPSDERFAFAPKWLNECVDDYRGYPVVSFERDHVYVDGYLASNPAGLREELLRVKRNWSILQPGRPFPGRVLLRIERDYSASVLQPWLDAMYEEGYRSVVVMFDDSVKSLTQTLGYVSVRRSCGVELLITPCARPTLGAIDAIVQRAIKRGERHVGVTISSEVVRARMRSTLCRVFRGRELGSDFLVSGASPSTPASALYC